METLLLKYLSRKPKNLLLRKNRKRSFLLLLRNPFLNRLPQKKLLPHLLRERDSLSVW
jgi:hypothetical protein